MTFGKNKTIQSLQIVSNNFIESHKCGVAKVHKDDRKCCIVWRVDGQKAAGSVP